MNKSKKLNDRKQENTEDTFLCEFIKQLGLTENKSK